MKNLILSACLLMVLVGCKKSGVNTKSSITVNIDKTLLIGKWKLQKSIFNQYTNGNLTSSKTSGDGTEILTLNSDGTGGDVSPETNFSSAITYTISSDNISITYLNTSVKTTQTGKIKVLTNNQLEIYFDYIAASGSSIDDIYSR